MIHKFEKADVCDLGAISVELSKEDEEPFAMFKGRNRPDLNDMLLVNTRHGTYLVKKEYVSIREKNLRSAGNIGLCASAAAFLTLTIATLNTGTILPIVMLVLFELSLAPFIVKIPSEVRNHGFK